jgi:hypothetical protein
MHTTRQRPKTLLEVAERAHSLDSWGLALGDFLDEINFRRENRIPLEPCLHHPPKLLRREFPGGEIADAFGAALADYISAEFLGATGPAWAKESERYLSIPWYPDDSPRIHEYLAQATPAAFREHGVFIDVDSLARV